jgi:hypothetical protein
MPDVKGRRVRIDYFPDEKYKFRISFNWLKIGNYDVKGGSGNDNTDLPKFKGPCFFLDGEFSTRKEDRESATRFLNVLGILKSMEREDPPEIVFGEGLEAYRDIFKNSYKYGQEFLQEAIDSHYKDSRKPEKIVKSVVNYALKTYPELSELGNIMGYHVEQNVYQKKGRQN